jgi:general secretion pathway protein A
LGQEIGLLCWRTSEPKRSCISRSLVLLFTNAVISGSPPMYEEYFGLKKKPFSIVPDPAFFFMSEGHREGLAHLMYGIQNEGGFVLLTGEVGTGKTTICRRLLELMPEDIEVAFILNPKVTAEELLATICDEFGIRYPKNTTSIKVFVTRISDYLLEVHEKGRRAVVIIEEAQNLNADVLEQIRLLTNLETNERKLLQMIMLGQPELRDMLLQPQLSQLSQRVTARYHLGPLLKEEVPKYVEYRLSAAGLVRGRLFSPHAMKRLIRLSGGVPRLINVVCDRALLGAYVQERNRVDVKILTRATREVFGEEAYRRKRRPGYRVVGLALLLLLLVVLGFFYYHPIGKVATDVVGITTQHGLRAVTDGIGRTYTATATRSPATGPGVETSRPGGQDASNGPASAPATGTLRKPPDHSESETREAAHGALFDKWHLDYATGKGKPFCSQARSHGLECLTARGGMADLRQMNKPAVLKFIDEKGGRYYATLTALKGETATFRIGNETRTVQLREIAGWWAGDYLLLWRRPLDYRSGLKQGATGPMVDWLASHLAGASGKAATTGKVPVYDRTMMEQVKQFQLVHGIAPDGIVGPRTIIGLTAVVPDGDPVLCDVKEGGSYVVHP